MQNSEDFVAKYYLKHSTVQNNYLVQNLSPEK